MNKIIILILLILVILIYFNVSKYTELCLVQINIFTLLNKDNL